MKTWYGILSVITLGPLMLLTNDSPSLWMCGIFLMLVVFLIKVTNHKSDLSDENADGLSRIGRKKLSDLQKELSDTKSQLKNLEQLSTAQLRQQIILDTQLTRTQGVMKHIMVSLHGITEGQAKTFVKHVVTGDMDNRGVRPYINECLGVRRAKRNKTGNPRPGDRIIDLS